MVWLASLSHGTGDGGKRGRKKVSLPSVIRAIFTLKYILLIKNIPAKKKIKKNIDTAN